MTVPGAGVGEQAPSPRGRELARYEASPSDQRALAYLRATCAVLASFGAVAVLLGDVPIPVFLVALLGLLISLAWLGQARRSWRAAAASERPQLVVYETGFSVSDTGRNDWLAFSDVKQFEVDEERVDILVTKRDASTLRVEPRYTGVDIYQLVHTLDKARASAQSAAEQGASEQEPQAPDWRASGRAR
jgi:hypothetical protein